MKKEFKPRQQEELTLDEQILEINNEITKAQDFIQSLEGMQKLTLTTVEQKDLLRARIDLAELQTQKDHLLDEKIRSLWKPYTRRCRKRTNHGRN